MGLDACKLWKWGWGCWRRRSVTSASTSPVPASVPSPPQQKERRRRPELPPEARKLGRGGAISVRASRSTNSPVLTYLPSSSFFLFQPHCAACGTVIPQPGIEPVGPAVETWSPKHWTSREFPALFLSQKKMLIM